MEHTAQRTPVHLWIVGVLSLLWNCIGGVDYTMTRLHNDAYLKTTMPSVDPQVIYNWADNMPIWAAFGWALGVWAALLGSVLLLLRNRYAVHAFGASLVGMVLTFGQQMTATDIPAEFTEGANKYMPIVLLAVGIALFLYARTMRARGILR